MATIAPAPRPTGVIARRNAIAAYHEATDVTGRIAARAALVDAIDPRLKDRYGAADALLTSPLLHP